jgi:penicillin-binding protein 1A
MSLKKHHTNWRKSFLLSVISLLFSLVILGGILLFFLILSLPSIEDLKDVKLQAPLKIYSADGKLIGEFGTKRLTPIKIDQVPKLLTKAVLDTEDRRFYEHQGVDFIGIIRAAKHLFLTGKKTEGASTITMQLARNFFLSPEKTYTRKLKEILLALKIEREFSKDTILELYLNKVYFGQRAYGIAAAAEVYYGKNLYDLNLPEMAMIAGLPQAPSRDNPLSNPKVALERRNHVLKRMLENNDITLSSYNQAVEMPLDVSYHGQLMEIYAPYVAEMVRAKLMEKYGEKIYGLGYKVYTSIDSHAQNVANKVLRDGLIAYNKRHGYNGPESNLGEPSGDSFSNWRRQLQDISVYNSLYPAAVIKVDNNVIMALLADGQIIKVSAWAQYPFTSGNVIRVYRTNNGRFELGEMPKINGALVALDPKNGGITALVGGFSYAVDQFNCAIQADRQAGSSIKPFIYAAALDKSYTLSSIINDAPIILPNTSATDMWRPQNFTKEFYGPTRLRVGLIESRNVVSVRLLQGIGIPYAVDYIQRFGFSSKNLPMTPSLALGTASVSPIQMATGYAVFANGGYEVKPFLINRIEDENGKIIFQEKITVTPSTPNIITKESVPAKRVISPQIAYLLTDVMKNIVLRDASLFALKVNRHDLAGKTGTTNEQNDAWFVGFNSDMATAVWIGYNTPRSIHEYGSQAAFPIWLNFMQQSLQGRSDNIMAEPVDIVSAKIDPVSGLLAYSGQENAIFELFIKGTAPEEKANASTNENTDDEFSDKIEEPNELNDLDLF